MSDTFEHRYSLFMPRFEFHAEITDTLLWHTAKGVSVASPGLDAWTAQEVKLLPKQAWTQFLYMLRNQPETMKTKLVSLVKRVPIEKHDGVCAPKDVRPIDLFSVVLRVLSSATYQLLKPWTSQVLHPNQHATNQGALYVASKIAWRTEQSWAGLVPTFAIACDFTKMFNMMSVDVATLSAKMMGLSDSLADLLALPLKVCAFAWKLPFCAIETTPSRGLPQGMAGSVLLAECTISALVWKCHALMRQDPNQLIVAYVDTSTSSCLTFDVEKSGIASA